MKVDLKLPDFKGQLPESPVLSMDAYAEFVLFMWENSVDRKAVREQKNEGPVIVKFVLK